MRLNGMIYSLPQELKLLIGAFIIILSIGFYSGLMFVNESSSASTDGIEQQYLGNENDENAAVMKFKKSDREMLGLIHNHVLSMSIIFFLLGLLLSITQLHKNFKLFLMIEPFISIVLTFGGIYLLWKGVLWMKYVVMCSGMLMTLTFITSTVIIFYQTSKRIKS